MDANIFDALVAPPDLSAVWCISTTLYGVTSQKTAVLVFATAEPPNL